MTGQLTAGRGVGAGQDAATGSLLVAKLRSFVKENLELESQVNLLLYSLLYLKFYKT